MKLVDSRNAAAWLLALCLLAPGADADGATLQQVRNNGVLRVGIVLAPPWAMRGESGELRGFEIDVARRLAAELEVEPEMIVYRYDELVRALESGEIDIVAAGLTITPERALHVNFSRPYATGGIGIATNLAATADVESLDDLSAPEYTIAAIEGSVAAELAARVLSGAELALFGSEDAAARALIEGRAHAYLGEEPIPTFLALENPGRIDVPVSRPLLETRSAFAVARGDPEFIFFLNAWITAHEADTWLATTYRHWFQSLRWREERRR